MAYKFLIIDDNKAFRAKLKRLLQADWEDAAVDEYDPAKSGVPDDQVHWGDYNILFLDDIFLKQDWYDWFSNVHEKSGFPAAIVFSNNPEADDAVKVIKAGAENYLPKRALTRKKLNNAIKDILARNMPEQGTENPSVEAEEPKSESTDYLNLQPSDVAQKPGEAKEPTAKVKPVKAKDSPPKAQAKVKSVASSKHDDDPSQWPEIQGHKILKKTGQGGMSVIYLAERQSDGKKVVIKTLSMNLADNRKTLIRSNQEFKLISRISNPNIVKLYEHGTIGNAMYTTMEYFTGGDLKQRLRKGITQRQALQYMTQIANGLAAIHGCGIIHRDLKPGNIMFREDDTLAIIDFGISKDINTKMDLTDPGQVMGTPNYMAPEQGNGGYRPDARSDIYSVGVMLYEMLTGKKPYAAPTGAAIIYKHLHDPIPELPNQFYEMQSLLNKTMAKFPQDRFQSALDMIDFINKEFRWDITLDFV